jgi:hypothetical protein
MSRKFAFEGLGGFDWLEPRLSLSSMGTMAMVVQGPPGIPTPPPEPDPGPFPTNPPPLPPTGPVGPG